MGLPNGIYRTAAGSTVTISGKYSGISAVEFDWLEEGGCSDCVPNAYEYEGDLIWHCDECGGGRAQLIPATHNAGSNGPSGVAAKVRVD